MGWRINTLIYLNGIKISLENLYVNTGAQMLGVEYNYQPFWIIRASHGYKINLLVSHVSQNLLAKSNFWAFLCSYTLEFSTFPPNIPFFHLWYSFWGIFVFLADKDYFCNIYNHKSEFWWSVYPVRFHMSLVTFTHWLDFCLSGGGLVVDIYSFFGGGMQKKESTDFRSLEAGISGVVMRTLPPLLFVLLVLWKKTFTASY